MKVSPLNSLSAKLFFMTVLLVISTVVALAFQSSNYLKKVLEDQLRDRSTSMADNSAKTIEGLLDNWQSQLLILLQSNMVEKNQDKKRLLLESFLSNNDDYVAVQIFMKNPEGVVTEESKAFTTNTESNRFGSVDTKNLFPLIAESNLKYARKVLKKTKREMLAANFSHVTKLPLLRLTKAFSVKAGATTFYVTLTAWQTSLIETLAQSSYIEHVILDRKGKVFAARDFKIMKKRKSYKRAAIIKRAIKKKGGQGFEKNYRFKGKSWLGGFSKVDRFGLIVLVQQDTKSAYGDIEKSILQTIKWGALFVMVAILFSYFGARSVTRNLRSVTQLTQVIAQGNFSAKLALKGRDEVALLSHSVNLMSSKIQGLLHDQVAQAEVKKDLDMAKTVQETLFPKPGKIKSVLEIHGFSESASETGGDWWGHYSTEDGIEYVFVADAMGHGVPAALVTAVAYSSCMTLAHLLAGTNQIYTPGQILEQVNKVLYDAVEGKISMTFFALMVDYHEGKITYANAGHNLPVIIPKDADDDRVQKRIKSLQKIHDRTPISLNVNGTILGVEKEAVFKEKSMDLVPGDRFFLFTDGLIECKSPKGGQWQRKGMLEHLMRHLDKPLDEWMMSVKDDAYAFFADEPRDDDLTVVAVEFPEDAVIGGYRSDDMALLSNETQKVLVGKVGAGEESQASEASEASEASQASESKKQVALSEKSELSLEEGSTPTGQDMVDVAALAVEVPPPAAPAPAPAPYVPPPPAAPAPASDHTIKIHIDDESAQKTPTPPQPAAGSTAGEPAAQAPPEPPAISTNRLDIGVSLTETQDENESGELGDDLVDDVLEFRKAPKKSS